MTMRSPFDNNVLRILNEQKVKVITGGSIFDAVFFITFSIVVGLFFLLGLGSSVIVGIVSALFVAVGLLLATLDQLRKNKFFVFDFAKKEITKQPIIGTPKTYPLNINSLEITRVRAGGHNYQFELCIDLAGSRTLLSVLPDTKKSEQIHESIKTYLLARSELEGREKLIY